MILKGEKYTLRDWEIKDLKIYQYWETDHKKWKDFNGPYYPKITNAELKKQIDVIKIKIEATNWPKLRKNLIIADEHNEMLGTVSWYWQSKETHWLSIGLVIYDDKNWSKGIGYEALSLWISYLFETNTNLVRMDLRTWSGNIGMMKLAEKLGFKLEARFRDARIVNGKYYDSIGMGMLKSEWQLQTQRN